MKMNEKYLVVKEAKIAELEEQFKLNPHFHEFIEVLRRYCVDDAVVIRTQDVFAAGGLSAYEHQIAQGIAVLQQVREDQGTSLIAGDTMKKLQEIRAYFAAVAQEAEDRLARGECKLPD